MIDKKLNKKQERFINLVKSLVGRHRNYDVIEDLLLKNGFSIVDSGGYKTVFRRKNDKYCVKVYQDTYGWQEDSFKVPPILKKHYIHPIYQNKRYLIQKWIDKKHRTYYGCNRYVKKLPFEITDSVYDIHVDNIRVYGNKEVVIDFCYS